MHAGNLHKPQMHLGIYFGLFIIGLYTNAV